MSNRITEAVLQAVVDRINEVQGYPLTEYTGNKPNAYNYHLSFAYGGVALHQMGAKGYGGGRELFGGGHVPKRELYELMHAYLQGLMESTK